MIQPITPLVSDDWRRPSCTHWMESDTRAHKTAGEEARKRIKVERLPANQQVERPQKCHMVAMPILTMETKNKKNKNKRLFSIMPRGKKNTPTQFWFSDITTSHERWKRRAYTCIALQSELKPGTSIPTVAAKQTMKARKQAKTILTLSAQQSTLQAGTLHTLAA